MPEAGRHRPGRVGLPRPAARLADHRHGPRRRRRHVGRADRAPVPAGVRRRGRRRAGRLRRRASPTGCGWRSPPTRSWSGRCSSPAGASATWPSTGRSTTWPCRGRRRWCCRRRSSSRRARRWPTSAGSPGPRRGGRCRPAYGWSPATPRSSTRGTATACSSTPPASACCRTASTSTRRARAPATSSSSAATIGVHGVAVMSCREGLEFGTAVESDTAAAARPGRGDAGHRGRRPRAARPDPRRPRGLAQRDRPGGEVGIELVERDLPVPDAVRDACGLLGLDPLYVANEGKLVAFVPPDDADRCSRRCGRTRWAPRLRWSGTASTSTRAWSSPAPGSAARGWSTCRSANSSRGSAEWA